MRFEGANASDGGMKRRPRSAQRLLATCAVALLAAVGVAACGGSSNGPSTNKTNTNLGTVLYGTLPAAGTPVKGGVITQGQLTGSTPNYIFPIAPGANSGTGTFSLFTELFMPLYAGPVGAEPKVNYGLSAANPPQYSNNDSVVTIPMKQGLKWSNGAPIDANDVVFWFDLLKAAIKESPANWGQYSPGLIPDNIKSVTAKGKYTVVFTLKGTYNPGFFLLNQLQDTNGGAYPLPSTAWNIASANGPHLDYTNPANATKIYNYLNKSGAQVSGFATNKLWQDVSGPFKLKSFSATNSSYTLVPNANYGGTPKTQADQVQVNTYTDFTSELNALKSGSLDIMVGLDPSQLPQVPSLQKQGIDVFGGPGWGWFGAIPNFKDTAHHFDKVIGQLYIRQAIDHLIDQPAIIKGVYKGAAVPDYAPVGSAPLSPYTPSSATKPLYPYSPSAAVSLLTAHGWKVVPNGTTKCVKPGTASNECGAGIPAGTPISFVWANLPESVASTSALEAEVISSEAKKAAGINITLQTKSFNFLISDYNDQNPAAAKYTNSWGVNNYGGLFEDFYPTQEGVENPGAGFNIGAYNDATANRLMNASVHSGNIDAVKTEANYMAKSLPVFYIANGDYLIAVNTKKVGSQAEGWTVMTQQQWMPQYWYSVK
jgi:peptide/nickel transport system substrate-binding protein